jgi:twitching motility protein PilT
VIRQSDFFKLAALMETGAADGMFTWDRYRRWLQSRTDWCREPLSVGAPRNELLRRPSLLPKEKRVRSAPLPPPARPAVRPARAPHPADDVPAPPPEGAQPEQPVFEIDPLVDNLEAVVSDLKDKKE